MIKLCVLLGVVVLIGLAQAEIVKPLDPNRHPGINLRYPLITAPLTESLPTPDGQLAEGEWEHAMQLPPLVAYETGEPSRFRNTVWLTYGSDALYLACHIERPPGTPPPRGALRQGDHVEVVIRDIFGDKRAASFVVDHQGGQSTGTYTPDLQTSTGRVNGNNDWQGGAQPVPNGYVAEFAIPFSLLYRQTPAAGDIWELQLFVHQQSPVPSRQAWVPLGLSYDDPPFGYLRFGSAETPPLAVTVNPQGRGLTLSSSHQAAGLSVKGQLSQLRSPRLNLYRLFDWAAGNDALVPQTLPTPTPSVIQQMNQSLRTLRTWESSAEADLRDGLTMAVEDGLEHGLIYTRVTDTKGNLLLAFSRPISTTPLQVKARLLQPPNRQLWCQVDLAPWFPPPPNYRFRARLMTLNDRPLAEQITSERIFNLSLPEGLPANATLEVALLAAGQVQTSVRQTIALPPPPAWQDPLANIDQLNQPPPPWSPLAVSGSTVRYTNGQVDFSSDLQPRQLTRHGRDYLAGPVRLEIATGGRVTAGPVRTLSRSEWALSQAQSLSGQGILKGELRVDTAYDGFIHSRLNLAPVGDRTVGLRRLRLTIPLQRDYVRFYRHGPGETRAYRSHRQWSSGPLTPGIHTLPFTSCLWLGDGQHGIELVMPTNRHWFPLDREDCIRIDVQDDLVLVTIEMAEAFTGSTIPRQQREARLTGPALFQWGLQATPALPPHSRLPASFRLAYDSLPVSPLTSDIDTGLLSRRLDAMRFGGMQAVWFKARQDERGPTAWHPDGPQPGFDRAANDDNWRLRAMDQASRLVRDYGFRTSFVDVLGGVPANWATTRPYLDALIAYPPISDGQLYRPDLEVPFTDWFVDRLADLLVNTQINGLVIREGAFPIFTADLATGSGWYDQQGRLRGSYPVFALRRFHERIWLAMHGNLIEGGHVLIANPVFPYACASNFADGQMIFSAEDLDVRTATEPWRLPVHAGSSASGVPVLQDVSTSPLYWAVLQEAIPMLPAADLVGNRQPVIQRLWESYERFPWSASRRLAPWQEDDWVGELPEGILRNARIAPGHLMLAIANVTDKSLVLDLDLQLDSLPLAPAYTLCEIATGKQHQLTEDNRLQTTLPAHDWRLYYFAPAPPAADF